MKTHIKTLFMGIGTLLFIFIMPFFEMPVQKSSDSYETLYWFDLHRKSNVEILYFGPPQDIHSSRILNISKVKSGIPHMRPTPLPQLLGKEYWLITGKQDTSGNPETAPYFLTLDIPATDKYPFGPVPYNECTGQCNWVIPGEFGLHGVNGNLSKLSENDPGSSGCIRHADRDIVYLYFLLNPERQQIRYYISES